MINVSYPAPINYTCTVNCTYYERENPSSSYLAAPVTVLQNGCGVFNGYAFTQGHVNKLGSKIENMR